MKRWNQPHRKKLRRELAQMRAERRVALLGSLGWCGVKQDLLEAGYTHTAEYARVTELCSEGQ